MDPRPSTVPLHQRRLGALVALATAVAVAVRAAVVLGHDGLFHPDEVYQSLEQAHRLAFGYGLVPWEFDVGARHWLFPAALAAVMRAGAWASVPPDVAGRLAVAVAAGATAWACARLVRASGGTAAAQLTSAATWAALALAVVLGARALSESAATLPLTLGVALALDAKAPRRAQAVGGLLLATATMLRLHCALVAAGVAAVCLARRDWRRAAAVAGGLAAGAAVMGAVDVVSWGDAFHSAREYLRFNLVEGRAAEFGTGPASLYSGRLWASWGALFPVLAVLAACGAARARGLGAVVVLFLAAHLATPHKELRFLLPVMPLAVALAALGVDALRGLRREAGWAAAAALAAALLFGQTWPWALARRQLDAQAPNPGALALDEGGPENRLLRKAGRRPEVCGLWLRTRELGYSGGYAWFHRRAPLYDARHPPPTARAVNAAIAPVAADAGVELAREGDVALYFLGNEACDADAAYDFRLR